MIQQQLEQLCDRSLAEIGLRLTDVAMVSENRRSILRINVDYLDPGPGVFDELGAVVRDVVPKRVNVDVCARASRHLSAALDVDDTIQGAYVLEVSSPGLRRSVRRMAELRRFVGFKLKVTRKQAVDGSRVVFGVHRGLVDDENSDAVGRAILRLAPCDGDADGEAVDVQVSDISKAVLNEDY